MAFDPEVIGPSSEKWSRAGRCIHKCAIDSSSEVGVLSLIGLIKTFSL